MIISTQCGEECELAIFLSETINDQPIFIRIRINLISLIEIPIIAERSKDVKASLTIVQRYARIMR